MYTETLTNYHKFYLAQEIDVLTQSEIIKQPEEKRKKLWFILKTVKVQLLIYGNEVSEQKCAKKIKGSV